VGCLSAPVSNDRGFRRTGYVEFALNDQVAVQDAARYFPAFFHFDRLWHEQGKELPVMFNWEIEGAAFLECNTDGFTCSVSINTDYFESQPEADASWGQALALLSMLLSSIPRDPAATAIY
jgi:hypothetical protein